MDQLNVNKKEMHHPVKHIIIVKKRKKYFPILIDFERCKINPDVKNITQFAEFICRNKNLLEEKKIIINIKKLRSLAEEYKSNCQINNPKNSKLTLKKIVDYLSSL